MMTIGNEYDSFFHHVLVYARSDDNFVYLNKYEASITELDISQLCMQIDRQCHSSSSLFMIIITQIT